MNDELSGQLCDTWTLPKYSAGLLYACTPSESVLVKGNKGEFTLSTPSPVVTVRWGAADGISLAQLRWRADALGWQGRINLGGMVDAVHLIGGDDHTIGIAYFSGQVLLPHVTPFPRDARRLPTKPSFFDSIDPDDPLHTTWWVMDYDSPLFQLAHDAMSNKLNCFFFGRLSSDDELAGVRSPMPFSLDEATLFST
jgi:hypothetical protein